MQRLILFDIDGTLLHCGGAGRIALDRAFEKVLGLANATVNIRFGGNTDPKILDEVMNGRGLSAADADQILDCYVSFLKDALEAPNDRFAVLGGAHSLLSALSQCSDAVLGLATGNIERGARVKLSAAGLNDFFGFGGFGSDAAERSDLVIRAIERGEQALGETVDRQNVWVIGDTEYDVRSAKAVGARSVGVLAGAYHPDELIEESPDLLVESLEDRALWSALGL